MGSWWNRQKAFDAGSEFLRTGSTSAFDRLGYGYAGQTSSSSGGGGGGSYSSGSSSSFGRCRNSEDCGSGFGCVNGECIQTGGSTGNISGSSSVSCGDGGGGGGSPCGGGGPSGCSQPSCAGGGIGGRGGGAPEDCCGERCCRFGGFGVQCYCGPCPPPSRCQKYCDAFYKSNNRQAEGCGSATTCTECETCQQVQGFWTECVPAFDAPCQCEQSSSCDQCENCGEDGSCEADCASCETCVTMYNIDCGCKYISVKCCNSACSSAYPSYDKCREKACAEACPDPPEECGQQCETTTTSSPCSGDSKQVGVISAAGETLYICQDCSDDPNCEPEPPECSVDEDCGDCESCNEAGKCVHESGCGGLWKFTGIFSGQGRFSDVQYIRYVPPGEVWGFQPAAKMSDSLYTSTPDPNAGEVVELGDRGTEAITVDSDGRCTGDDGYIGVTQPNGDGAFYMYIVRQDVNGFITRGSETMDPLDGSLGAESLSGGCGPYSISGSWTVEVI